MVFLGVLKVLLVLLEKLILNGFLGWLILNVFLVILGMYYFLMPDDRLW